MTDTSTEAVERLTPEERAYRVLVAALDICASGRKTASIDLCANARDTLLALAAERDALKAEVGRLREALLEQSMPCTCREAYSGRGLQDPECPAGEYGDDCRAAIGLSPLCQFNVRLSAPQENTDA